ncbi:TPA: hypothetical protein ACQ71T_003772, partial [Escherichia coli]
KHTIKSTKAKSEYTTVRTMALCVKRPLRERLSQRPFQHNAYHIMRTNINQGRIQSLAVMIVLLINNGQTPYLT